MEADLLAEAFCFRLLAEFKSRASDLVSMTDQNALLLAIRIPVNEPAGDLVFLAFRSVSLQG